MEVEQLVPVASSPLDYARGRGNFRRKPIVIHIEFDSNTVSEYSLKRVKTRRNSNRNQCGHAFLDSLHTVGLHVQ